MTLLTKHLEAGWHEVESGEFGRWVAERFYSRPGASSSVVRVEAESSKKLQDAVSLRQSQLDGTEEPVKDTITNDGTLVTGPQHEALRTEGATVIEAEKVSDPVPNEDEAKQVAGLEDGGFNPDTPFDPTEGSVNAPQVPSDAADQGLSPEAVSASETASGSADTSTDPSQNAEPATTPPPEGQPVDSLPEEDHAAVLAAAESETPESQSTPSSDEVDATPAAAAAAEEHGVDLAQVEGSGQDGRVLKSDVEAAASDSGDQA